MAEQNKLEDTHLSLQDIGVRLLSVTLRFDKVLTEYHSVSDTIKFKTDIWEADFNAEVLPEDTIWPVTFKTSGLGINKHIGKMAVFDQADHPDYAMFFHLELKGAINLETNLATLGHRVVHKGMSFMSNLDETIIQKLYDIIDSATLVDYEVSVDQIGTNNSRILRANI